MQVESTAILAATEEINVDAALAVVFFRNGWHFHIKRGIRNSNEGFSIQKRCFCIIKNAHRKPRALATWLN